MNQSGLNESAESGRWSWPAAFGPPDHVTLTAGGGGAFGTLWAVNSCLKKVDFCPLFYEEALRASMMVVGGGVFPQVLKDSDTQQSVAVPERLVKDTPTGMLSVSSRNATI